MQPVGQPSRQVVALRGPQLHRVHPVGDEHRVVRAGLLRERVEAGRRARPEEPAARCADAKGKRDRCRGAPWSASDEAFLDQPGEVQRRRNRLGGPGRVCRAQPLALRAIGRDACRDLGSALEIPLHRRAAFAVEAAIHIAVHVVLGDRMPRLGHLTLLRQARLPPCSGSAWRSFSRARARRDITVPIGIPSTRATSVYDMSSTHTSSTTQL